MREERLRDDPSLPGLRQAIVEEASLSHLVDRERLKAQVLSRLPAAAPATPVAIKVGTALVVGVLAAGNLVLWRGAPDTAAPKPASPTGTPPRTAEHLRAEPPPAPPQPPSLSLVPEPRTRRAARPQPFSGPAAPPPATPAAVPLTPPAPPPPIAAPAEPVPASTLAQQLRLYEVGAAALRAGRWQEAKSALAEYLGKYPSGEVVREAKLSLVEALVRLGAHEAVVAHTTELLADEGVRARTLELLRARADALVALRRCEEARRDFGRLTEEGLPPSVETLAIEKCTAE